MHLWYIDLQIQQSVIHIFLKLICVNKTLVHSRSKIIKYFSVKQENKINIAAKIPVKN